MSRWNVGHQEFGARCSSPTYFGFRYGPQRDESNGRASRSFALRISVLAMLCSLFFVGWNVEASRAEIPESEKRVYTDAVAYCRGNNVARPMALRSDKLVLCYDGPIAAALDLSLSNDLAEDGLFVVRSFGGDPVPAVKLAEALRERHATIVVYDYCLSACASYLLFASTTAFVLRNTLVAWSYDSHWCLSFEDANDRGPKRLERKVCADASPEHKTWFKYYSDLDDWFYWTRTVVPRIPPAARVGRASVEGIEFEHPPESASVRRILNSRFDGTGRYPRDFWTWNPRYYASTIKTRVVYEAYPQTQDEVDAMAAPLQIRVIFDP